MQSATDTKRRLILKTEDDVLGPLIIINMAATNLHDRHLDDLIDSEIATVRDPFVRVGGNIRFVPPTRNMFLTIGAAVCKILLDDYNVDPDSFKEGFVKLLLEKHKRYGAEPILAWGGLGVMVRIHSKFERYMTLKRQPELDNVPDENIIDTLTDILGYSVIGYHITE